MEDQLFTKSFYAVWQAQVQAAVEDVKGLSRNQFTDPALDGVLQAIVEKHRIDIAQLQGEVTAKRRTEQRQRQDSWDDVRSVWLDLDIPFVGEAETFRVGPSNMLALFDRVRIGRQSITLTVPDDDGAEQALQEFKKNVEHNLEILRREYEAAKPQLKQAVQQAAAQRKTQIEAEDGRDKGRSFRVTN
jgi:ribosomal protein S21